MSSTTSRRLFSDFIDDMIIGGMTVVTVKPDEMKSMEKATRKFALDFNDAYQYAAAKKHRREMVNNRPGG